MRIFKMSQKYELNQEAKDDTVSYKCGWKLRNKQGEKFNLKKLPNVEC